MAKRIYNIKKTISVKQFISEFGESFSEHMKERLMELELRGVLTRKEDNNRLDLKHVEHKKYNCPSNIEGDSGSCQKEYAYGQFAVIDGELYFDERCEESEGVMESPIVSKIYNSLDSDHVVCDEGICGKRIDDTNVDFVIDNILTVCPNVSKEYLDIMSKYIV